MRPLLCGVLLVLAGSNFAFAQANNPTSVEIVGHVVKPAKLEPTEERIATLSLPAGFKIDVFARGLINPRVLAISDSGTLYATRREVGDVVMIKDTNNDGRADLVRTVASRPHMHGIAIDGSKVYLVTVHDIYVADLQDDGSFGELVRIVDDLPDAGQHADRTIAVGPDGMLYVSVGSTCNACNEPNPENATILQVKPDGSARKILASGLRNTIGFAFEPKTGALYGADHGIDWLGDDQQPEEINLIEQGKTYGWPYIYGDGDKNPQDEPPGGITLDEWASASTKPVLKYTAHAAPMQMAFYNGGQFPADYRGDAFLAMHGSWNRNPPSGYEVVRIRFEDGKPKSIEPFVTSFLSMDDNKFGYFGRPFGLAVAKDGALFVGDDTNGVIYRVSYANPQAAERGTETPDKPTQNAALAEQDTPSKLAGELIEAENTLKVASPAFAEDGRIPVRHSAYDENVSPEITWSKGPVGTKSYVLLMEDPDAKKPKPVVHWVLFNIPADVTALREGIPGAAGLADPKNVRQAANTRGSFGYFGPRPPADGDHHYHFQVFALDTLLNLKPDAGRRDILDAMKGHVLAKGDLVGILSKADAKGA